MNRTYAFCSGTVAPISIFSREIYNLYSLFLDLNHRSHRILFIVFYEELVVFVYLLFCFRIDPIHLYFNLIRSMSVYFILIFGFLKEPIIFLTEFITEV